MHFIVDTTVCQPDNIDLALLTMVYEKDMGLFVSKPDARDRARNKVQDVVKEVLKNVPNVSKDCKEQLVERLCDKLLRKEDHVQTMWLLRRCGCCDDRGRAWNA